MSKTKENTVVRPKRREPMRLVAQTDKETGRRHVPWKLLEPEDMVFVPLKESDRHQPPNKFGQLRLHSLRSYLLKELRDHNKDGKHFMIVQMSQDGVEGYGIWRVT